MRGIVKEFPGVRALDGVDLDVRAGEVHCLLGQNGAGKSTLIKVLSGAHQPDEGEIRWDGEAVALRHARRGDRSSASPRSTRSSTSSPGLTVAENIFLGHEVVPRRVQPAPRRQPASCATCWSGSATARSARPRGRHGCPPAAQQIVSMARALSHDTRLIIMDEPSAVLDQEEVAEPVPRHPRPDRRGRRRSSTSPTGSRRSARSATGSPCSRTAAPSPPGSPARGHADPRADPADDRPIDRVRLPAAPRDAARSRRRRARGRRPGAGRESSAASTSPCAPARSSGLAGLVGLRALGDPGDGVRRPPGVARHGHRRRARRLRNGSVAGAVAGRHRAWHPRSARARACCSTRRSTATSPSPAWAGSPAPASSTARPSAQRPRELTRSLDVRPPGVDRAGAHPVRRQPAEGRAGPLAAARLPGAAARRADPRRRRRRPQRDLRSWSAPSPTPASPWSSCPARSRRCSAWPTGCWWSARARRPRGPADRDRRAPGARPGHGRKRRMTDSDQPVLARPRRPSVTADTARVERGRGGDRRALGGGLLRGRPGPQPRPGRRAGPALRRRRRHRRRQFASVDNVLTILRLAVGDRRGQHRHDLRDHRRRHRPVGRRDRRARVGVGDHPGHPDHGRGHALDRDGRHRARGRRRAAAWSTGCWSPTAGSSRSSRPWPCWPPPAGWPRSSPSGGPRSSASTGFTDFFRGDVARASRCWSCIFAAGGGDRLGRAQPHHVRPAHLRRRRQPRGGPAGRHQRQAAHGAALRARRALLRHRRGDDRRRARRPGSSTHGTLYELDAIAAVVIGGTLLTGGRGTIVGTVLGVLIFTTLSNVFTQNNLSSSAQAVAKGLIIVVAVLLQQRLRGAQQQREPLDPDSITSTAASICSTQHSRPSQGARA